MARAWVVAGAVAACLWGVQGTAAADDPEDNVRRLGYALEWNNGIPRGFNPLDCVKYLKELTDAKADPALTFSLGGDVPGLKAGVHRWQDARPACALNVTENALRGFVRWASIAKDELGRTDGVVSNSQIVKNCLTAYDEAIQAGVSPTQVVEMDGKNEAIKDIRDKLCGAGLEKLNAAKEAEEAPYRKVLSSDKLALWLKEGNYIGLAGGKETPARLAAARVWFQHRPEEKYCANGKQLHTLRRWQFDAKQKLMSNTIRDYCGQPPAGAWR